MTLMIEKNWLGRQTAMGTANSSDEWLGPETHVPNLERELRQRSGSAGAKRNGLTAGIIFLAGVAIGSLAALFLSRSRRNR